MRLSRAAIQEYWPKYLAEGILLFALGVTAAAVPAASEAGPAVILGTLLLLSGLGGLVATFHTSGAPGTGISLTSALLAIVVGTLLLLRPALGITSLTLIVVAFLFIEGVLSTRFAIEHQLQLSRRWHWMLASGVLDLILAVALLVSVQTIVGWALDGAIALDLIGGGWALVGMALAGRQAAALSRARRRPRASQLNRRAGAGGPPH